MCTILKMHWSPSWCLYYYHYCTKCNFLIRGSNFTQHPAETFVKGRIHKIFHFGSWWEISRLRKQSETVFLKSLSGEGCPVFSDINNYVQWDLFCFYELLQVLHLLLATLPHFIIVYYVTDLFLVDTEKDRPCIHLCMNEVFHCSGVLLSELSD